VFQPDLTFSRVFVTMRKVFFHRIRIVMTLAFLAPAINASSFAADIDATSPHPTVSKPCRHVPRSSTADIIVPLCPAIAEKSYPEAQIKGKLINFFADEEAMKLGIIISPLSEFFANIHGRTHRVRYFYSRYKYMLCSFNPRVEAEAQATFLSCMGHADSWIEIARSSHPDNLMLNGTLFVPNCVPTEFSLQSKEHQSKEKEKEK
jgi:hypothetical protein